jgi:hypothetical protein
VIETARQNWVKNWQASYVKGQSIAVGACHDAVVHDPWEDRMPDNLLVATGRAAGELSRPEGRRTPPREVFRLQLEECRAEWRRRNPGSSSSGP